jgi:ankyrin repeat protein
MMAVHAHVVSCCFDDNPLISQSQWTALMWVANRGYMDCASVLLDDGAEKDLKDQVSLTY